MSVNDLDLANWQLGLNKRTGRGRRPPSTGVRTQGAVQRQREALGGFM